MPKALRRRIEPAPHTFRDRLMSHSVARTSCQTLARSQAATATVKAAGKGSSERPHLSQGDQEMWPETRLIRLIPIECPSISMGFSTFFFFFSHDFLVFFWCFSMFFLGPKGLNRSKTAEMDGLKVCKACRHATPRAQALTAAEWATESAPRGDFRNGFRRKDLVQVRFQGRTHVK